jgi:alkanesulfonate monooxygenase SsuD/methylene tetrahydromethanopterin reductase-like flavin-dependent oxidoreductase (luciferase family)
MRLGISLASFHPGAQGAESTAWTIERALAAGRAGLDVLSIGDHHSTGPVPYVQNTPMMGRLLADWGDRPAGCLFLVPSWNAVLMAEQIATLACIARGPFVVQTGLGSRGQLDAMGIETPHQGRRLEATVLAVQALLAGDTVDEEQLRLRGARIAPLPPRGIEWWIGAHSPPALDRAARLGDGWYADAGLDQDLARTEMAGYLEACARHDREPGTMALRKDVFVAEDGAHAERLGQGLIDAGYRGGMRRGAVAFGSPAQVAEQLSPFAELGFTDILIRTMNGIGQPDAVRSIELAGEVRRLLAAS